MEWNNVIGTCMKALPIELPSVGTGGDDHGSSQYSWLSVTVRCTVDFFLAHDGEGQQVSYYCGNIRQQSTVHSPQSTVISRQRELGP